MSDCPLCEKCPFFNDWLSNMPPLTEQYKDVFCYGNYQACARFIVRDMTGILHPTLMPHEIEKVDGIIEEIKSSERLAVLPDA